MKKRHHQSKAARHREHAGMERHERGPVKHHMSHHSGGSHSEMYDHHSRHDASHHGHGMIEEDHRAIANMPQEVMIKSYPVMPGYMPEDLDDTISSVDHFMSEDHSAAKRGFKPGKF